MKSFLDSMTYSNNVYKVYENSEKIIFKICEKSGEGNITFYNIFSGVYIMLSDFNMYELTARFYLNEKLFCIDHCREGSLSDNQMKNGVRGLSVGQIRIYHRCNYTHSLVFPTGNYYGLTIIFQHSLLEENIEEFLDKFSIKIEDLRKKYGNDSFYLLADKENYIENLFSDFYSISLKKPREYFRIKILEILLFLQNRDYDKKINDENVYLNRSFIDKTREVKNYITANLDERYTISMLSEKFAISETTLKDCFKYLYGEPIYSYAKKHKMNCAAKILRNNQDIKIIDLAGSFGYDSPSKFAAAFKKVIGITPAAYRKKIIGEVNGI